MKIYSEFIIVDILCFKIILRFLYILVVITLILVTKVIFTFDIGWILDVGGSKALISLWKYCEKITLASIF